MKEKIWRDIQPYIEQAGGLKAINESMEADEQVMRHFWENEDYYLEKYPGKWIVVTLDGAAVVGDDLEEVVKEAHRIFAPGDAYHIEFMNPEPVSWLL